MNSYMDIDIFDVSWMFMSDGRETEVAETPLPLESL
jgi:hypothetical protein